MAISSNNIQVYTTLSKQINMILTEYYKTQTTTKHESE